MNIKEKIEQINKEPEHIRMRYVLGCVAVSRFVIFIVWIFSIISMFTNKQYVPSDNSSVADIQKQFQDLKEQAPSLKSLGDQSINAIDGSNATQQNTTDNTYSSPENNASEIPASDSYSKLPSSNANAPTQ